MKVEIEASTIEELREKVALLAVAMGFGGFSNEPSKPDTKSKKKKAEDVAPTVSSQPPTLELASELIKKVNDTKGLPIAREILTLVGANRMSEVPAEKYGEVIAACEKILA